MEYRIKIFQPKIPVLLFPIPTQFKFHTLPTISLKQRIKNDKNIF